MGGTPGVGGEPQMGGEPGTGGEATGGTPGQGGEPAPEQAAYEKFRITEGNCTVEITAPRADLHRILVDGQEGEARCVATVYVEGNDVPFEYIFTVEPGDGKIKAYVDFGVEVIARNRLETAISDSRTQIENNENGHHAKVAVEGIVAGAAGSNFLGKKAGEKQVGDRKMSLVTFTSKNSLLELPVVLVQENGSWTVVLPSGVKIELQVPQDGSAPEFVEVGDEDPQTPAPKKGGDSGCNTTPGAPRPSIPVMFAALLAFLVRKRRR